MKLAHALVVGGDLTRAVHLRDLAELYGDTVAPFQDEIRAVEKMYKAIWQLHVYLDPSQMHKASVVKGEIARAIGFPNDGLLELELQENIGEKNEWDILAERSGDVAPNQLGDVLRHLDMPASRSRGATPRSNVELAIQAGQVDKLIREGVVQPGSGLRGRRGVKSGGPVAPGRTPLSEADLDGRGSKQARGPVDVPGTKSTEDGLDRPE
jgi:hypothetical protein